MLHIGHQIRILWYFQITTTRKHNRQAFLHVHHSETFSNVTKHEFTESEEIHEILQIVDDYICRRSIRFIFLTIPADSFYPNRTASDTVGRNYIL